MQRLALLTDGAAFELVAMRRDRLTDSELALWRDLMVSTEQRRSAR
jgi:hypothetical protein